MRQYDATYHKRYVSTDSSQLEWSWGRAIMTRIRNPFGCLPALGAPGDVVEFHTAYTSLGHSSVTYNNSNKLVVQNKKASPSIYADGQNMYYNCW
jgi:hypothetical protein